MFSVVYNDHIMALNYKPLSLITITKRLLYRLNLHTKKSAPDSCWEWQGGKSGSGYGQISIDGKLWMVHRIIYYLHYGYDPDQLMVCHKCDNPPCCNPFHLFLGDAGVNIRDCIAKKRFRHRSVTRPECNPHGEGHGLSKLTDELVIYARKRYAVGGVSQSQLAKELGVGQGAVAFMIEGKTWRHLPRIPYPKRTGKGKSGEASPMAKLSTKDVNTIRSMYKAGTMPKAIAPLFMVSASHVSDIVHLRKRIHG